MVGKGDLSEAECVDVLAQKKKLLREIEIEMEAHVKASQQTFLAGLGVIELMGKSHTFMTLDGFELDKARLVKMVLSNPTLKDGKLEYHYEKAFDVLVVLTRHRNWWTRRIPERTAVAPAIHTWILLSFSRSATGKIPRTTASFI